MQEHWGLAKFLLVLRKYIIIMIIYWIRETANIAENISRLRVCTWFLSVFDIEKNGGGGGPNPQLHQPRLPARKSNSRSKLESPTRKSNSKIQLESPTRKSNSKVQLESPTRKFNSKVQLENPTRKSNSKVQLKISTRYLVCLLGKQFESKLQFQTSTPVSTRSEPQLLALEIFE